MKIEVTYYNMLKIVEQNCYEIFPAKSIMLKLSTQYYQLNEKISNTNKVK